MSPSWCSSSPEGTGWLRYGGDVEVGQFNFAGIGAVGGGAARPTSRTCAPASEPQVRACAYADPSARPPIRGLVVDPLLPACVDCSPVVSTWVSRRNPNHRLGGHPRVQLQYNCPC